MKHWPLGVKLAVWSVLVVSVALSVSILSTRARVRAEEIEELDSELARDADHLLQQFRLSGSRLDWINPREIEEVTLSSQNSTRSLIIADRSGHVLYRSGLQSTDDLLKAADGLSNARVGTTNLRFLKGSDGRTLVYCFAADMTEINGLVNELTRAHLVTLPAVLAIAVFGGWWLARQALRPIRLVADAVDAIRPEDLSTRLQSLSQRDDIGRLTKVFNRMLERLERGFKQATRFSADASHELRTPLTVLHSTLADLLNDEGLADKHREAVVDLQLQTLGLISTTNSLLLLARADAGRLRLDLEDVDFAEIVAGCVDDARIVAEQRGIEIEYSPLPFTLLRLDPVSIGQILSNLLDNALKYNSGLGGRVKVEIQTAGQRLILRIGNTGQGVSDKAREHLFERFYRAGQHEDIPGTGLGLSLARELARSHGGELLLSKNSSGWTEFELQLPNGPACASPALAPPSIC